MKKRILLLLGGFVMVFTALALLREPSSPNAEPVPVPPDPMLLLLGDDYEEMWKRVDSLEQNGLYQSAIDQVEVIFDLAVEEKNHAQVIKAIIYDLKYSQYIDEEVYAKAITNLEQLVVDAEEPSKQLMHSITAQIYYAYLTNNYWRFQQRSHTADYEPDDLRTWDLKRISDGVIKHYLASLKNPELLQGTDINSFETILIKGNTDELRPTLFDFLSHRAFDHLSNSGMNLAKPQQAYVIEDPAWFGTTADFLAMQLPEADSLAVQKHAAGILQDLIRFRKKYDNIPALVDVELKRLRFAQVYSVHTEKNKLVRNRLMVMRRDYEGNEVQAQIDYERALFHEQQGYQYDRLKGDDFRWEIAKAVAIADSAAKKHPDSYGGKACLNKIEMIKRHQLHFELEESSEPEQPFRMLIQHKNIDKLYARIVKIKGDWFLQNVYQYNYADTYKELKKLDPVREWQIDLTNENDYQNHYTETHTEGMPYGLYMVILCTDSNFTADNQSFAYAGYWSTRLSYVYQRLNDERNRFQVMDRFTGKPLANVKAKLYEQEYDYDARKYKLKSLESYTTDSKGQFTVKQSGDYRNYMVDLQLGKDRYNYNRSFYQNRFYPSKPHTYSHIFTDRAIFRPGQEVHFKGILLHADGHDRKVEANKSVTVTLKDVNYQKVADLKLKTNEFGTYKGSFTLPSGLLNGQMSLTDGYNTIYFSVEEYKRPKFEVSIDPVEGNFRLNSEVKVTGKAKAYAGSTIDGAEVKYRVVRNARFPYWCFWYWGFYPTSPQKEITFGETRTKPDGSFEVVFIAEPDAAIDKKYGPIFSYQVIADVTDINGETRSSQSWVYAGYQAMELNLQVSGVVNTTDTLTYPISAVNLNGQDVDTKGEINIWKLKQPEQLFRQRFWVEADYHDLSEEAFRKKFPNDPWKDEFEFKNWEKGAKILTSDYDTKKSRRLKLTNKKSLAPGRYLAEISGKDAFGEEVKSVVQFIVFSPSKMECPTNEYFWSHYEGGTYEPGDKAVVWVGTAAQNAKLRYDIEVKNKIVHTEWIDLNSEVKKFEVEVKEEHRGNFSMHFVMVKDGRVFSDNPTFTVPHTDKELDITFETFRNKLIPGQDEEWRMRIKDKAGDKALAEVIATMYDASLDAFRGNSLYMNVWESYYSRSSWNTYDVFTSRAAYVYRDSWDTKHHFPTRSYDNLQHFNFYYMQWPYYGYTYSWDFGDGGGYRNFRGGRFQTATGGSFGVSGVPANFGDIADETVAERQRDNFAQSEVTATLAFENGIMDKLEAGNVSNYKNGEFDGREMNGQFAFMPMAGEDLSGVALRKDFSETAFFFPDLTTDENGDVLVKFTIPEALTRWKFMALAHTKDLKVGTITEEVVTQKKLMIMPNQPRFFRHGDKITFSAKLSNLDDKDMMGEAELRMLDALTMQPVNAKLKNSDNRRQFLVKTGESSVLKWELEIPEGIDALTYQVVAKAGKYSDGEEMAIPVLTNRMLVTESLPLPVRKGGTQTFVFDKLKNNTSKTLRHHKLTLEYTSNPAWYAVQAMPYMMEYPYECAEQTFTRYYTNTIGTHLMNSNPKIKQVFDSWKTKSPESFLSNLEKNQELKSALLEETPWVLQSQDETERKNRIAVLFDLNRMKNEQAKSLRQLRKMQVSNGGWPWFKGMPDDRYITQHIVTGLGHLDHLGIKLVREDRDTWDMTTKAIAYLDARIREDYEHIKKNYPDYKKNQHISYLQVQYLYARSYFRDVKLAARNKEAFEYFFDQAKTYWKSFNEYNEGMIALGLHRYEETGVPKKIMASLKERALHHDELGMYWKNMMNGGYYWYQAPIETQALLIEAFDEVADDQQAVEDMKVWLLKQKQTQDWRTTKATAEAVYALLLKGTDLLADDKIAKITLGAIAIQQGDPTAVEPEGIRYVDTEAGTGYLKTTWSGKEITPEMATVKVTRDEGLNGAAWGALYWQYFEDLDKITPHETPLKLEKKLFLEQMTEAGPVIEEIKDGKKLKPGDRIKVRIVLRTDRRMEYVHMKDMRAAGFEPENVISRYRWQDGLGYYEVTKDASTNFFFSSIGKGTYVFEYPLRVSHEGDFSNGITTIQCMYAPEFTSHSEGIRVKVGS